MFSVTRFGVPLDPSQYNWNEDTKTFFTEENDVVLDFSDYNGIAFKTGRCCTFKTGDRCIFNTYYGCTFITGDRCIFNTYYGCVFHTGYACIFNTGNNCAFKTGSDCTFHTGVCCTFHNGANCTFQTGGNCVSIRYDVEGIVEIPENKKIKFNPISISGYTVIDEKPSCNGKEVIIDGKKYRLQEI